MKTTAIVLMKQRIAFTGAHFRLFRAIAVISVLPNNFLCFNHQLYEIRNYT